MVATKKTNLKEYPFLFKRVAKEYPLKYQNAAFFKFSDFALKIKSISIAKMPHRKKKTGRTNKMKVSFVCEVL